MMGSEVMEESCWKSSERRVKVSASLRVGMVGEVVKLVRDGVGC